MLSLNDLQHFAGQMAGYLACDIDDTSDPKYYGFTAKDGSWYIIKESVASKTFRYAKGSSNYTTNWTGKADLTYDYPYNTFNV